MKALPLEGLSVAFSHPFQQSHVVINIHGHTHDSPGRVTIGKTVVINPGPLQYVNPLHLPTEMLQFGYLVFCCREGHFGVYTLQAKARATRSWELASSFFYTLL